MYCGDACYENHARKVSTPSTPSVRAVLNVRIPADMLPECLVPCTQCGETFVPDESSFWVRVDQHVEPICSAECREGYDVKQGLIASDRAAKRADGKVRIHGARIDAMILDDNIANYIGPGSESDRSMALEWARKVLNK
jgi:hypothetical protein